MNFAGPVWKQLESRWLDSQKSPHAQLLRLIILREISRTIHAMKSQKLAKGDPDLARQYHQTEVRIESLKNTQVKDLEWNQIFDTHLPLPSTVQREVPPTYLNIIGPQKIDRFDRKWEAQILAESAHLSWQLWHIDAWVVLATAEESHHSFDQLFWPDGAVLFVEGAPREPVSPIHPRWKGRWYFVLKPELDPLHADLAAISGLSLDPEAPIWKKLYAPR